MTEMTEGTTGVVIGIEAAEGIDVTVIVIAIVMLSMKRKKLSKLADDQRKIGVMTEAVLAVVN